MSAAMCGPRRRRPTLAGDVRRWLPAGNGWASPEKLRIPRHHPGCELCGRTAGELQGRAPVYQLEGHGQLVHACTACARALTGRRRRWWHR